MAMVLPLLLLIIFAVVWFGLLTYTHIVVQLAAAQGARVAAAAIAEDPTASQTPTPEEKARGFVRSVIQGGLDQANLEAIEITGETIAGEDAVRVSVAYRFKLLVPFMDEWGVDESTRNNGLRVVRSSVYRIEVIQGP